MNWTGGRLQRHSKANTNATLKAQKQHYAKARLHQQNGRPAPSPLRLPGFRMPLKRTERMDQDETLGRRRKRALEGCVSAEHKMKRRRLSRQLNDGADHSSERREAQDPMRERDVAAEPKVQQDPPTESRKSAQAEENALDSVKHNLLRRSDWMGLTAARPLHMNFPSAQELESIGRRRRITTEDRRRQDETQRRHYHSLAPGPVSGHRRPQNQSDDFHSGGVSIRIGSNIHRSQTTRVPSHSQKPSPSSVMGQTESSESMLLDKEVSTYAQPTHPEDTPALNQSSPIDSLKEAGGISIEKSLLSLDQVRDSETFDEVKARSDSIDKRNSANHQQRLSKSPKRRAVSRSLASEDAKSSSMVVGRRLLRSTPSPSEGNGLHKNSKLKRPGLIPSENIVQQLPDSLSSDFLPRTLGRDYNSGGKPLYPVARTHRVPSNLFSGSPDNQMDHLSPDSGKSQLPSRSTFTLELQAEAEASVSGRQLSGSMPNRFRENQTCQDTSFEPTESGRYRMPQTANISTDVQGPTMNGSQVASSISSHRYTPARSDFENGHEKARSLQSAGRINGLMDVSRNITTSSHVLQANGSSHDRAQLRQSTPMRQSLGMFKQPDTLEGDWELVDVAQGEENQPWMRFILQDDREAISKNFYTNPNVNAHDQNEIPQRWLGNHPSDDRTLSEDHGLQSTRLANQIRSSSVQTIKTAANTVIHGADLGVGSAALGTTARSETDFLSQLSPMEGQLDERLFNPSVYTNPARTERSYVAAPSQIQGRNEYDAETYNGQQLHTDMIDSSSKQSTQDYSERQVSGGYESNSPPSRLVNGKSKFSGTRKALRPITNPSMDPRRILQRGSGSVKRPFQNASTMAHRSEEGNLGSDWVPPPSVERSSSSARRQRNRFPMDYTPMMPATKWRGQGHPIFHRPASSYSLAPHVDPGPSEAITQPIHHPSSNKLSSDALSSSQIPITNPDIRNVADGFIPFNSPPIHKTRTHPANNPPESSTPHPPHNPFSTPRQPLPHPPADHFPFTKPLTLQPLQRTPPPPGTSFPSSHFRTRRPVTPLAVAAFSTPRPMRTSMTPRQTRSAPVAYSTPRPVRSVLGGLRTWEATSAV